MGSALLAASAVAFDSVSEAVRNMIRVGKTFEPRRERAAYFHDKCAQLREECHRLGYD